MLVTTSTLLIMPARRQFRILFIVSEQSVCETTQRIATVLDQRSAQGLPLLIEWLTTSCAASPELGFSGPICVIT